LKVRSRKPAAMRGMRMTAARRPRRIFLRFMMPA
jgi:hypothetical protein